MTLNQIAVQLADPLGKQFDQPFLAMVKDLVVVWTERMIRNALDKNPKDRMFFRTPPIYLPLHPATADCSGVECPVMETNDLPSPLRANSILFDFVGSVDGSTAFPRVTDGFEQFHKANKYASRYLTYRWTGRRIQIMASGRPEKIKVVGIFPNPRLLAAAMCGTGPGCNPDDTEYQVSGDILQLVMQYIADESLKNYKPQSMQTEVTIDNDAAVQSNRG